MATKISVRLQTPPDSSGNRTDLHPITTTDEVIVNFGSSGATTLTKKLNQTSSIQIQNEQPKYACIWAKPIR